MALTRIKTDQIDTGAIGGDRIDSNTDITSNNLTLSGDLRGPATFTIDPAAIGDNTGTVVIAGDLQVDGETTTINSSTLTVDDKQIVIASGATDNTSADGAGILIDGANAEITYDGTNDRFEINKDVNVSGGLDVDSGTLFIDGDANRVGIGTLTPGSALDVSGDVSVSGNIILNSGSGWIGYSNSQSDPNIEFESDGIEITGGPVLIGSGSPSGGEGDLEVNGDLNVDSGTLFVDSANNRIGVGTSSPISKMHIEGDDPDDVRLDIVNRSLDNVLASASVEFKHRSLKNGGKISSVQVHPDTGYGGGYGGSSVTWDSDLVFYTANDGVNREVFRATNGKSLIIDGSLSKNSGSFKIDHPLPEKSKTHHLVHSFVESPLADNIYRGTATLTDGTAQVNIDSYTGMTEGTFSALNGNPQIFLQNESGFEPLKGRVVDNILHIQCRDETATDTISWMVVAERQDQHMLDTEWTDEFGRPVLEPEKNPEPDEELDSDGEVIEE